jgi:pyruvate dehydrogenase E1 component
MSASTQTPADREVDVLRRIEERVLWLSLAMVDHANAARPNDSGVKVGGHQGSSASMVSVMTSLWFRFLAAPDRVSVKPHASPVLHAINYLLGRLRPADMESLRAFGGLQSYPSRTKDPDPVDFSTGSVGIGATATLWAALAHRYVAGHFDVPVGGRHIALIGDAELDEGAIWEALVDPMVPRLGEVMWIVDLNRQSLDRVVPDIAAGRMRDMFAAAGWHTVTAKYGRLLGELFAQPGGDDLRRRIDAMSNEEYQSLLRADVAEARERLPGPGGGGTPLGRLVGDLDDATLARAIRDLGGHDLPTLLDAYREADAVTDRPAVVFAYTLKGWRTPTEGHPANHSALLTADQMRGVAERLGCDPDDPWAPFAPGSDEGRLCALTAELLERPPPAATPPPPVPADLGRPHRGRISTQKALGRLLGQLDRTAPEVAESVVTVSPDVATSTNLGGWINHVGVWALGDRVDWFAGDSESLVRWRESDHGRHVELGIAETNLVGLLGELGLTWDRSGQPLLPIGTLYDPFVGRALEPWSFGIYSGGQSILIGTPSGVSLAPEGGAHQSVVTPSIGIAQPGCTAWEPAFAQDLEWTLLDALGRLGRPGGGSAYFRLSTRPVDQALAGVADEGPERERRRAAALRGGYRLRDPREAGAEAAVTLVGMGAVMPEVLAAGEILSDFGVAAEVVCLTSGDLAFRALSARRGLSDSTDLLGDLFPPGSRAPLVTVLDGHPSALAFLAGLRSAPIACLGVDGFGQSGGLDDLYAHHGLDVDTIVGSAMDLVVV